MYFLIEEDVDVERLHYDYPQFSRLLIILQNKYRQYGMNYRIETCPIEAIRQDGWIARKFMNGELCIDNYTPVGGIEFMQAFAKLSCNIKYPLTPINIPDELQPMLYTGRHVYNIYSHDDAEKLTEYLTNKHGLYGMWHIKDMNIINYPGNKFYKVIPDNDNDSMTLEASLGVDGKTCGKLFDHDFTNLMVNKQISDIVPDIVSEWRIFIDKSIPPTDHHGPVIGCECYKGSQIAFPKKERIQQFIDTYTKSPEIYVLDVMVDKHGNTWVLGCHEYFSCELYGFESFNHPHLVHDAWKSILQRITSTNS